MQADGISFLDLTEPDFTSLADLCRATYPGREISDAAYLQWEYEGNPDGKAIISIAKKDTEIISQYIVIPRIFSIGNTIQRGSLSVNTLTHELFRGKNLFPSLTEQTFQRCKNENIAFTLGFPNPVSLPVIRKKNIFQTIGELSLLVRPLTPVKSIVKYAFGEKKKSGKEIKLVLPEPDDSSSCISPLIFPEDKSIYKTFLNTFNTEKQNLTHRSPEFLTWRYKDIPLRKYYLFKTIENNSMTGLAILRAKYIYGLRCGIIVDFCTLKSSMQKKEMIKYADSIARKNKLDLLFTAFPESVEESSLFRTYGFLKLPMQMLPQKLSVIVKKHTVHCPEQVTDFSKWFLTFGDYDIF